MTEHLKAEDINAEDLGLCPCGQPIAVDVKHFAVIHNEPTCKAFRDLEPDKFLTYVRRSRGIAIEN